MGAGSRRANPLCSKVWASQCLNWFLLALFWTYVSVFSIPPKLLYPEKSRESVVCSLWLTTKLFTSCFHSTICLWIVAYWYWLGDLLLLISSHFLFIALLFLLLCFLIRICDNIYWVFTVHNTTVLCHIGKIKKK